MNKIIPLSLVTLVCLQANEVELDKINVEATKITEVSQNAKVSADLAQALTSSVPSIDMSRRSGIANDILIRGQKRDNISVEVDGTKVCGACPNRMDPPVSHVLASQIDAIDVIEGPYDVETFGTMAGGIKIKTKQPTAKKHGEVNFGFGSWGYRKVGATASGGNSNIRLLVSGSTETSNQYVDGNGDTMAQQLKNSNAPLKNQYYSTYEDMPAYKKNSIMAKAFVNVTQDQELRLSYTANRSTNVLYPNTPMDAVYDFSNIYSVAYNVDDITDTYKNLNIQYYYSDVDHPMSTEYRNQAFGIGTNSTAPNDPTVLGMKMSMTSHLKTTMQGAKVKNNFDIYGHNLLVGLDTSRRSWDGIYKNNVSGVVLPTKSIDNAITRNIAAFAKLDKSFGSLDVSLGLRYDQTSVRPGGAQKENDYTGLNANVLTTYNINSFNKVFLGIGQANRVPDARELYFTNSKGATLGTPNLDQVTNMEADFGYETNNDLMKLKIKGFYSKLKNYIYIQKGLTANIFQNIDATVYGGELSASIYATDDMTVDMGASYKRGQKDNALAGQSDKDLADIAPLRGNVAVNYEYMTDSIATLETYLSSKWSNYDADNGEQELGAWGIVNAKIKHAVNKNVDFTLGVNNIFDETYAQSNTYVDLTLLSTGTTSTMLLNEPGRYVYTNIDFKF